MIATFLILAFLLSWALIAGSRALGVPPIFELDATMPIFILMFGGFMAVFNQNVLVPLRAVIERRQSKIKEDLDAASQLRQRANDLVQSYQEKLQKVRTEAQTIINDSLGKAQKERQVKIKQVQDDGLARLKAAKEEIQAEKRVLIDQLVEEERAMVASIVKKLLGDGAFVNLDNTMIRRALEEAH